MKASIWARPNTLIRFIGYIPQAAMADEEFISAWRSSVEHQAQPAGLIYRELCRQVPEWNAQITHEMQNRNPYDFIEYAIFRPDLDPTELPALPEQLAARYEQVEGLFTITYPFIRPEREGEPELVLFNCFEITGPPQVEQGFLRGWPVRAEHQSQQEGFFSALLYQRTRPETRIAAFNRAEWQDIARYVASTREFDRLFPPATRTGQPETTQGRPPVQSYLGLFRVVASFQGAALAPQETMKAVVTHGYGGPEVLHYEEVARPVPGPGQILLRVRAVGFNPLDAKLRSGALKTMQPLWPKDILGYDLAGVIEAVGEGVTERQVGEEVYGSNPPLLRGGYAEYVVAPARAFQPKPKNLDFVQATTVPSPALTAQNALFVMANLQEGQSVLIHGGAGAVTTFAIQLTKRAGLRVIATTATDKLEYVRGLGADQVIDYQTQRFEELVSNVDAVLDPIGGETRERSWSVLRQGGVLVTLVPPPPNPAGRSDIRAVMNQNTGREGNVLAQITTLIEQGELRVPNVELVVPLAEVQRGHTLFEQGKVLGRIAFEVQ